VINRMVVTEDLYQQPLKPDLLGYVVSLVAGHRCCIARVHFAVP